MTTPSWKTLKTIEAWRFDGIGHTQANYLGPEENEWTKRAKKIIQPASSATTA